MQQESPSSHPVPDQHDGCCADYVLSLRGGADGLSIVVPHGSAAYYSLRPSIAMPRGQLIWRDDTFGLHPSLQPQRLDQPDDRPRRFRTRRRRATRLVDAPHSAVRAGAGAGAVEPRRPQVADIR